MGLFGFGKKKEVPQRSVPANSVVDSPMNMELYKKLTSNIAVISFIMDVESDSGIFEGTYRNHLSNPRILALKNMSPDIYIKACGMHLLGVGMYVCYMQEKLKKSASDFSMDELKKIAAAWEGKDQYEVALNTFGIPIQSQQKASLDQIYVYGLGVYKLAVGNAWDNKENLRAYMKVMYDAGFTLGASEMSRKG